jgi:hypothetical protein
MHKPIEQMHEEGEKANFELVSMTTTKSDERAKESVKEISRKSTKQW